MPYIANTPESVLPRSDSLNPATTCRGLTSSGRPCRRPLTSSPPSTPSKGVVAVVGPDGTDLTVLFCWQHKDQAQQYLDSLKQEKKTAHSQLKPRSSIDTLVDRLGLLEIDEKTKRRQSNRPGRIPSRIYTSNSHSRSTTLCCCFVIGEEDEDLPASKPHPRPENARPSIEQHTSAPSTPKRPSSGRPSSQLIPPTIPPEIASLLRAELAKPISEADEDGYIYMFWVTPTTSETATPPSPEVASSLLPSSNRPHSSRRTSDAIRTAQNISAQSSNGNPRTIRLKIGRANNVQRRLNEWTRQCSHNLTLIRYYPYTPSSSSSSPSPARSSKSRQGTSPGPVAGRKVPHVHRVERLIHMELADKRVKNQGPCPECGKEHREWFEVEAHKEALRSVDDCIRRWVAWAERQP